MILMIAEAFDRIMNAVDDDAGIGSHDAINDDFTIPRRRLRQLLNEAFWGLDHDRLTAMVNFSDAIYMTACRLAPLVDDCVAKGIFGLPSVPRARRQSRRPRTGKGIHITKPMQRGRVACRQ